MSLLIFTYKGPKNLVTMSDSDEYDESGDELSDVESNEESNGVNIEYDSDDVESKEYDEESEELDEYDEELDDDDDYVSEISDSEHDEAPSLKVTPLRRVIRRATGRRQKSSSSSRSSSRYASKSSSRYASKSPSRYASKSSSASRSPSIEITPYQSSEDEVDVFSMSPSISSLDRSPSISISEDEVYIDENVEYWPVRLSMLGIKDVVLSRDETPMNIYFTINAKRYEEINPGETNDEYRTRLKLQSLIEKSIPLDKLPNPETYAQMLLDTSKYGVEYGFTTSSNLQYLREKL